MPPNFPIWLGDLHQCMPPPWVGIISTIASIVCGAAIGMERAHAQKPAGLRTMTLICLGSAIFTQVSIILGGPHDPARIAAQIVSGIGFLGAGAIMHERGLIIGITTGAGIWATAAVGVVIGTGHVAAGVVFSLLILGTLAGARFLSAIIDGKCKMETIVATLDWDGGKTKHLVQDLIDEYQHNVRPEFNQLGDGKGSARLRCCVSHREHRALLGALAAMPQVKSLTTENPASGR